MTFQSLLESLIADPSKGSIMFPSGVTQIVKSKGKLIEFTRDEKFYSLYAADFREYALNHAISITNDGVIFLNSSEKLTEAIALVEQRRLSHNLCNTEKIPDPHPDSEALELSEQWAFERYGERLHIGQCCVGGW